MIKSLIIFRPAGATGWKEEPVHEDPGAVVVGVIGAVPGAAECALLGADLL